MKVFPDEVGQQINADSFLSITSKTSTCQSSNKKLHIVKISYINFFFYFKKKKKLPGLNGTRGSSIEFVFRSIK